MQRMRGDKKLLPFAEDRKEMGYSLKKIKIGNMFQSKRVLAKVSIVISHMCKEVKNG